MFIAAGSVGDLEHCKPLKEMILNPVIHDIYPVETDLMDVDGVFYARTPCMLPLIKFLKNLRIKIDFSFPGHIHDLGQAFWESYLHQAISCGDLILLESNPSIVETTFKS